MMQPPFLIQTADGRVLGFDAVPKIDYSSSVRTTDHPVESGASVSDHAVEDPDRIAAALVITESPIARATFASTSASILPPSGPGRLDAALAFLASIKGQPVTVQTRRGVFTPCLIERFACTEDKMRRLNFAASFKVIRYAYADEVVIAVPAPSTDEEAGATSQTNVGQQATTSTATASSTTTTAGTTTEATAGEEQDQSALAAIYDAVEGEE
jgi:hypothetical protein